MKGVSMAFFNEKEQLYLETDVSGVSLKATLLQARDGMQFPKDEASNNMALQPIVFLIRA